MQSLSGSTRALGLGLALLLCSCQSESTTPLEHHESQAAALSIVREGDGPYVEGNTERLRAVYPEPLATVRWNATAGRLEASADSASWRLPAAGTASLTVTAVTKSGQELSATYQFQVTTASSGLGSGEPGSLATAGAVDASNDLTGQVCELAFDASGRGHILYDNGSHTSLWYGTWDGSTWTTEQVEGLGMGVGGLVSTYMAMAVAADGTPHLAYWMTQQGQPTLWYATRGGTGAWVRERINLTSAPASGIGTVSIVLDPARANRPTVVFDSFIKDSSGYQQGRVAVAWRTGPNTWAGNPVSYIASQHQFLQGDAVISSDGTVFFPFGYSYYGEYFLGSYRPGGGLDNLSLANYSFGGSYASLVWAGTNRLLARTPSGLFDFNLTSPMSGTTIQRYDLEQHTVTLGDLVYTAGKPYIAHLHDSQLELVSPRADNYWTYTQLGTAQSSGRIGLAVRPTTGQLHVCYRNNYKVMFQ
ncbi:hypothetical protein JRI60_13415 [Archangium violaceum]|uniref:hypothetical protein n=1 Tax=Archangium violaceum TaxID=83451 RepID=UPI001950CD78|nr:hypothetical protein [Archangium violaceum]QRN99951.1 hypothetical protein JRI60_13415 [Archangium violaceum]